MNLFESKMRKVMKEQDLFLSNEYRQHFQNLADMVTQRFDERISIRILWDNPTVTAYTDNETVTINANCDIMQTREERFVGCIGFLAHELGHVLYTDFCIRNKILKDMAAGVLPQNAIAGLPDDERAKEMLNSIAAHPASFASIFAHIENCLEDRYIEHEISKFYVGTFKSGLQFIQSVFRKNSSSYELNLMNSILMQARGILSEAVLNQYPLLSAAESYIDRINNTHDYLQRVQNVFAYIHCIWAYVKELIQEDYNADTDNATQKSSEPGNRAEGPMSDKPSEPNKGDDSAATDAGQMSISAIDEDMDAQAALGEAAEKLDEIISQIAKALQADEKSRQAIADEYDQQVCASPACGGIDANVKCVVTTSPKASKDTFNAAELLKISRELQQRVQRSVIRRENGIKKTGLSTGRKIDVRAYARGDSKMFTKTSYPNKKPILSVCVAMDGSGSMSGNRIAAAQKALFVLNDFCQNTHVPLSAFGFNYGNEGNRIAKFFNFDDTKDKTAYKRIFSYKPDGNNRDGFAIKFAHEKLKPRKEVNRLLIIISDGRPSAYRSKEDAVADIHQTLKQLRRERITPLALAIGDDMDALKTIYGDALVDARELEKLPAKLTQYLQRYLV